MHAVKYIKQAILSEIEGYEFYKLAANRASSAEVRATFLDLANEERKHVEWLQDLLKQLSSEDTRMELEQVEAPPSPDIFNWSKLDREDPQMALSVFGIALQLEKASYHFYNEASENIENEKVKNLFKILAAWEKAHYDTFSKEYKLLQENWWAEQQFSPF
jgi:rubrerythrin